MRKSPPSTLHGNIQIPSAPQSRRQGVSDRQMVAERFHYDYSEAEIAEVSERALGLAKQSDEVHVVFNNNSRDFAPVAAERLRRKLGQVSRMSEPPRKQGTLL